MNTHIQKEIDFFSKHLAYTESDSEQEQLNFITPLFGKFFTGDVQSSGNDPRAQGTLKNIIFRIGTPVSSIAKDYLALNDYFFFSLDDEENAIIGISPFNITQHSVILNDGSIKVVNGIQFDNFTPFREALLFNPNTQRFADFTLAQIERLNSVTCPYFIDLRFTPSGTSHFNMTLDMDGQVFADASPYLQEKARGQFFNFIFLPEDCAIHSHNHYIYPTLRSYYSKFTPICSINPIL